MYLKLLFLVFFAACSQDQSSDGYSATPVNSNYYKTDMVYSDLKEQTSSNQDSSLKVGIRNYPTGNFYSDTIDVSVFGNSNVDLYAFKLGPVSTTRCHERNRYQVVENINSPISLRLQQTGQMRLCVIGGSRKGKWLPYTEANSAEWNYIKAQNPPPQPQPQPQPPVNNDGLIDDNDYNDGFGNGNNNNPNLGYGGYEWVRQSDNYNNCYPVCKDSDSVHDGDWGYSNQLSTTCVLNHSPKKIL